MPATPSTGVRKKWSYELEYGESIDPWIDQSDGTGRTANTYAMLTLDSGESYKARENHGSVVTTLGRKGEPYGRWEIRMRAPIWPNGGTDYRVRAELLPTTAAAEACSEHAITFADSWARADRRSRGAERISAVVLHRAAPRTARTGTPTPWRSTKRRIAGSSSRCHRQLKSTAAVVLEPLSPASPVAPAVWLHVPHPAERRLVRSWLRRQGSGSAVAGALAESARRSCRARRLAPGIDAAARPMPCADPPTERRSVPPKELLVSEIKVVRVHADERQDQTVTTGTKAWELFADDTGRDRGPGRRRPEGPRLRARRRRRGRGRGDRQRRRPRHPAPLRPPT